MKGLLFKGQCIDDMATYNKLPKELQDILNETNGYISLGGGFHLRGACFTPKWHSIANVWNGEYALLKFYPSILPEDIPFAQDCFGDQYVLRQNNVLKLCAETGDIENMQMGVIEFFSNINRNPVDFLLLQPFVDFYSESGILEPGQLLSVYPPFCFEEAAGELSIEPIDSLQLLLGHARLSQKLSTVLPGEKIDVRNLLFE